MRPGQMQATGAGPDVAASDDPVTGRSENVDALALTGGKWTPHDLRRKAATTMAEPVPIYSGADCLGGLDVVMAQVAFLLAAQWAQARRVTCDALALGARPPAHAGAGAAGRRDGRGSACLTMPAGFYLVKKASGPYWISTSSYKK
jgi:hypothetical protein